MQHTRKQLSFFPIAREHEKGRRIAPPPRDIKTDKSVYGNTNRKNTLVLVVSTGMLRLVVDSEPG